MGLRRGALESMGVNAVFWNGKTVLLTGHTGFKGGWLALWLQHLGAKVIGYALPPNTEPNLFEQAGVADGMTSIYGDVRDGAHLASVVMEYRPDIVFHLAAQPLVRYSYEFPTETYAVNVMGTVNMLDAVRHSPSVRVCQIITTDKCYENREWDYPYREIDRLGGHDPYSSSKACAELVSASYRQSYFSLPGMASVATARAGNVIGGGDWALDRILPDCIRALGCNQPINVRNPAAIRPWQHVLEPLSGYLLLAEKQWSGPQEFGNAWNFGPGAETMTVGALVDQVLAAWGEGSRKAPAHAAVAPHEAGILKLDISKAESRLGWHPVYDTARAIFQTVRWYRESQSLSAGGAVRDLCLAQIAEYSALTRKSE